MPTPPAPLALPRPCRSSLPRLAIAALAIGSSALFCHPNVNAADIAVSAQVGSNDNYRLFYDKLSNDGDWYQTDQYGYVFRPHAAADKSWRPYTDGYWAQTHAGWTWVSNESYGWATYHYGRWANVVDTGWVWVPGADWSPAYVSWRVSKDHKRVGWAPLPPEAVLDRSQGIEGWSDTAYDVGPEAYVFIDTSHFGETSYRTNLIPVDQNVTIITETENVTRVSYREVDSRTIVYAGGPDVTIIREATGQPVREFQLQIRSEQVGYFQQGDPHSFTSVNGNQLVVAMAGPEVIRSNSIQVRQPAKLNRLANVSVDRGYRGIGDPQKIESVRNSLRAQSPPPPPQVERTASAALHRGGASAASAQPIPTPTPGNASAAPVGDATKDRAPGAQQGSSAPAKQPAASATPAEPAPRPSVAPQNTPKAAGPPHSHNDKAPSPVPAVTPEKTTPEARPEPASTPRKAAPTPAAKAEQENGTPKSESTAEPKRESARPEGSDTASTARPAKTVGASSGETGRHEPSANESHKPAQPAKEAKEAKPKPEQPDHPTAERQPSASSTSANSEKGAHHREPSAAGEKEKPTPNP